MKPDFQDLTPLRCRQNYGYPSKFLPMRRLRVQGQILGMRSWPEPDLDRRHFRVRIFRRKKFLVDKSLQLRFLLINLSYAALLLFVTAASLFAPLIFKMENLDPYSSEASDVAASILYLHRRFWLPVFLTLILGALHSLKITHRLAGPLFRFRSVFNSIEAGILPKPVKLRKNDFLDAELNAINRMTESLRLHASEINILAEKLHESASKYGELLGHSQRDKAAEDLWNDIAKTENQLKKTLGRYRIDT
jgi:hypothetical protein